MSPISTALLRAMGVERPPVVGPPPPPPPGPGGTLAGVGSAAGSLAAYPKTSDTTAGNWFVDPVNGSDAAPGTSVGTAFKTLDKALSVVTDGQTILVRAGRIKLAAALSRSAQWSTGIKVWGYGAERPILDGANMSSGRLLILAGRKEHWRGFEIVNGKDTAYGGTVHVTGAYNTLDRLNVHDCLGTGIYGYGAACAYNVIQDSLVWKLGDGSSQGTNVADGIIWGTGAAHHLTAVRTIAQNNPDDGFDSYNGLDCTFWDCVAIANGYYWTGVQGGSSWGDGAGFKLGGGGNQSARNKAIGCLAILNRSHGVTFNLLANGGGEMTCNTAAFNGLGGIYTWAAPSGSPNVLNSNISWGNGDADYTSAANNTVTHNSWQAGGGDPKFADRTSGDYSLLASSPYLTTGQGGTPIGASDVALQLALDWSQGRLTI